MRVFCFALKPENSFFLQLINETTLENQMFWRVEAKQTKRIEKINPSIRFVLSRKRTFYNYVNTLYKYSKWQKESSHHHLHVELAYSYGLNFLLFQDSQTSTQYYGQNSIEEIIHFHYCAKLIFLSP
jgi:hypothetical protein